MIRAEKISHKYLNQTLFENLSFHVRKSDKFVIKGKSGGGKSTILLAIAGIISIDSGTISIDNEQINNHNAVAIRKKMCWLPQNPNIIGKGNTADLIAEKLSYSNINYDENSIIANLQKLNLDNDIIKKDIEQLSGGEKQRIAIIICKMLNREIMLLDEPTSALDAYSKKLIADYLLNDATTIVSVSHDAEWIELMNNSVEI